MRRRVIWLIVPLCWALSCGGRYDASPAGDDETAGTASGQGGSAPARAGAPGKGGTVSRAGAPGRAGSGPTGKAGSAAGGTFGATGGANGTGGKAVGGGVSTTGGFAQGGACACDPIACGPGYVEVPNPGGCCFHCAPAPPDCRAERERYLAVRAQVIEKYSTVTCSKTSDCTYYWEKNACGTQCGIPMAVSVVGELASYLDGFAKMTCSAACPPLPAPACEPMPFQPSCFKVWCE